MGSSNRTFIGTRHLTAASYTKRWTLQHIPIHHILYAGFLYLFLPEILFFTSWQMIKKLKINMLLWKTIQSSTYPKLLNPCSLLQRCAVWYSQHLHAIHSASHQKGKKHTRCLTSYLDAVSVGCVHDSRNQVFSRLPVVVSHPGRIPGQDQDPWSTREQGEGSQWNGSDMQWYSLATLLGTPV